MSTVWLTRLEMLLPNTLVSADVKLAERLCEPPVRVDTFNVALPAASTGTTPSEVVPSRNSTEPAGIPVAGATAETLAFNVTGFEKIDGFGELVNTVAVPAVFTT